MFDTTLVEKDPELIDLQFSAATAFPIDITEWMKDKGRFVQVPITHET